MSAISKVLKAARALRPYVPEWLVSAAANCGGTNLDPERFAGALLDPGLTDAAFLGILHSLIFPNGVRKTTQRARNLAVVDAVLKSPAFPRERPLRVLDIGAAAGLDALGTRARLARDHRIERYVLGDLHTHVLYERRRQLVFDADHELLQVKRPGHFVAVHFAYNFPYQRLTNAPKQVRPWLLKQRLRFDPAAEVVEIPLVHRDVDVSPGGPFELRRMNVFEPIAGPFDLIFCMHLLVPRYFSPQTIQHGVDNLGRALAEGGLAVVGATESYRVFCRREGRVEALEVSP